MAKNKDTATYTEQELEERVAAGESKTDWKRLDATSEADLEAAIEEDPDEDLDEFTGSAFAGLPIPPRKTYFRIGLDEDLVAWFKRGGRGYQTRMNAVLRQFYERHRKQRSDDART